MPILVILIGRKLKGCRLRPTICRDALRLRLLLAHHEVHIELAKLQFAVDTEERRTALYQRVLRL